MLFPRHQAPGGKGKVFVHQLGPLVETAEVIGKVSPAEMFGSVKQLHGSVSNWSNVVADHGNVAIKAGAVILVFVAVFTAEIRVFDGFGLLDVIGDRLPAPGVLGWLGAAASKLLSWVAFAAEGVWQRA